MSIKIKDQLNKIDLNNLTNEKLVKLFPELPMQYRYNLMEAKLNEYMKVREREGHICLPAPKEQILNEISRITKILPTQIIRSSAKDKLQQFSTPLHIAYFMTELLDPQRNDIVLDSSAGTGNLLTFINGVRAIYANEIDPHRAEILKYLGYKTTSHNAEFIHDLLDPDIEPNKIIMNPPFSVGLKASKNKTEYGFKHLTQALFRLKQGGRLVCLLGESCMNHKNYWNMLLSFNKNLRICKNYKVDGKEFYKQGTTFGTNIIVLEKTDPDSKIDSNHNFNNQIPFRS